LKAISTVRSSRNTGHGVLTISIIENGRITRVRYQVLAFAVALAAITYLDRVCIAQTADLMMRELRLSPVHIAGALYLAGALCWLFVEPGRPIKDAFAKETSLA
jgi:hypothetical protein